MQLSADGIRFDIEDRGSGPAIVLLHGFPLAKETWEAQSSALCANHRVVAIDLRGLGRSAVMPGPYLMETLAGDVAAIMDVLRLERATIVGHSLGGYVAFAFWRMFAERCAALGIVCSRPGADDPEVAAARYELADRAERDGIEPVVDAFVPRYFAPQIYERAPDLVARVREIVLRTAPAGAAAMLRGMAERVASDDLFADINVPVTVIAGSEDAFGPVEKIAQTAHGVAGARLEVLACGHFPMWEMPDETTEILMRLARAATSR